MGTFEIEEGSLNGAPVWVMSGELPAPLDALHEIAHRELPADAAMVAAEVDGSWWWSVWAQPASRPEPLCELTESLLAVEPKSLVRSTRAQDPRSRRRGRARQSRGRRSGHKASCA